jgi:hypothetical protein
MSYGPANNPVATPSLLARARQTTEKDFSDKPPTPCVGCVQVAAKSDLKQFRAACRAAGLSTGQAEILHDILPDLKGPNGLTSWGDLYQAACDVKIQFPNK